MTDSLAAHAWRVKETADYIVGRGYTAVTLQLPDELLGHATQLAGLLQAECSARGHAAQLYVLADTTYNSLSVDEVAAQHVGAQCVIHYGRASMTKLSRLPAFYVFPEAALDVPAAAAALAGSAAVADAAHAVLFLDQPLLHLLPEVKRKLSAQLAQRGSAVQVAFAEVPAQHQEPQQQQQQQQQREGSCCRTAGCAQATAGPSPPQQQQQEEEEEQQQEPAGSGTAAPPGCCEQPVQQGCCGGEACGAGAPSMSSMATAAQLQGAAALASAGGGHAASGDEPTSSSDAAGTEGDAPGLAGYAWQLPPGVATADCTLVWLGSEAAPALLQLQMTYSAARWVVLDTAMGSSSNSGVGRLQEGLPLQISRALRRRYYLVEKARVANIVGILVGTLGVAGYRDAIQRLRAAAQAAGKKTYTLLMGKPSPAKLANFPEIEVFVMVADPQGQILDCKDYLAPIITPYEAMLAFSPAAPDWDEAAYRLDFDTVLEDGNVSAGAAAGTARGHFSLLDGTFHDAAAGSEEEEEEKEEEEEEEEAARIGRGASAADPTNALALRAQEALQLTPAPQGRGDLVVAKSAADYLHHKRTYLGLETPLVGAEEKEVVKAVAGLSGRAAGYADEPPRQ